MTDKTDDRYTVRYYIEDDVLFKDEPLNAIDEKYRRITSVMTKDAFIACYNKWIKEGES